MIRHDDKQGEIVAGWYHVAFAAAYLLAMLWHIKGAKEHFVDARKK